MAAPSLASAMPIPYARRLRDYLDRWGHILPLLIAEAAVWVGFGAMLPILPIYFTEHGTDLPMLGLVIAAWPAARLVGEPLFGWLADRAPRKRLMILGLLGTALFAMLPILLVGPLAFLVLRALAGLTTALYDPAARGYLVDANPPDRQGETFGMYGAAQMGGLMIGPAIGGIAAAVTNEPTIVFWVGSVAIAVSALLVAWRVPAIPPRVATRTAAAASGTGTGHGGGQGSEHELLEEPERPRRLLNVLLVSAVAFNVGAFFASGVYEVVWSLYLTSLGAGLDAIGLTFAAFALPVLLFSPFAGRLIDRRGGFGMLVGGMAVVAVTAGFYPAVPEVWFVAALSLVEGAAFAVAGPALYLLVSRGAPAGRSSTAQGIFGAAGTIGTIVASLSAGVLADVDLRLPFYATAAGTAVMLGIGLTIGRQTLRQAMAPRVSARAASEPGPDPRPVDAGRRTDEPVPDRAETDPWPAAGRGR
jgi:MFS family permease